MKSGNYLWNAGMFVWRVDTLLAELSRQQPQLAAGVSRIAHAWDSPSREQVLGEIWPTLPRISVDYAVMEGAATVGRVGIVPATSAGTTWATSTPSARCWRPTRTATSWSLGPPTPNLGRCCTTPRTSSSCRPWQVGMPRSAG